MPKPGTGPCRGTFGMPELRLLATVLTMAVASLSPATGQVPPATDLTQLKADYKRPAARPIENRALVELGHQLFWDPRISASGRTACGSCHFPYLAYAVTDPRSRNDSGKLTSRKSQPLIGLGHAVDSPYGWDGRNVSLEAQVKSSIATGSMSMRETEAPVKVEVIEARIQAVNDYAMQFQTTLPGTPITIDAIATAIAAYERTVEPGPAPFDRWIEGDESAISESAKRGFVLFNGKANCVACHGGWRFTDDSFHDIGTSTTDLGRGRELKDVKAMQYAFKTPTLRSVSVRPPYMHNAMATDLDQVVRHYEQGGIDRPSRSAEIFPFTLTEAERHDLVAFMQTLTGMPEGRPPPKLP
jgi:cytochrome c peroxidase